MESEKRKRPWTVHLHLRGMWKENPQKTPKRRIRQVDEMAVFSEE